MLHLGGGLMIHIIVILWGCHDNGVVRISVRTNERRVETPTLHHRAAPCAGRWIRFVPEGPWHDGVVVYVVASLIHPSGEKGLFSKIELSRMRCPCSTSWSKMNGVSGLNPD
jgi:hypothetical protein